MAWCELNECMGKELRDQTPNWNLHGLGTWGKKADLVASGGRLRTHAQQAALLGSQGYQHPDRHFHGACCQTILTKTGGVVGRGLIVGWSVWRARTRQGSGSQLLGLD